MFRPALAAALVLAAPVALAVPAAAGPALPNSADKVLWAADTARGPSSFAAVQCKAGNFGTVQDAAKGKVWRAKQVAGEERCETLSPDLTNGSTIYVGWSSRVRIDDDQSRYVFQLKCSPSEGTANHPVEIDIADGRVRLQEWDTDHVAHPIWSAPVGNDQWHRYVLKLRLGRTDGTIDFWYDGVKQTFTTGSGTYTGTTWDGTRNYLKWGSYHPSPADAVNTFTSPVIATTYDLVKGR
ncbi:MULTISPECIES: heparin lyase I family protein [Kitasatospora]|uniref:Polysaccharide lyase n=1 Tax=Kitasatospora setae (strain ATCC 33774 / DSM 43861 / JCM 3304 / KCC A-0304 / NBRC 14216 / KM-6054) TaxID=452652 RepID=E4NID7_KITSK|nr:MULTISPECIES: heparin lyase I family protein [Kitasatospora]BAJ31267.1 hypothetical protein KSE_54920 [Kitasatospora setae KM-6054]